MLFTWIVLTVNYPNMLARAGLFIVTLFNVYNFISVNICCGSQIQRPNIGLPNKLEYINTQQRDIDFLLKFNKNPLQCAITVKMLNLLLVLVKYIYIKVRHLTMVTFCFVLFCFLYFFAQSFAGIKRKLRNTS